MALSFGQTDSQRQTGAPPTGTLAPAADDLDHYHVDSEVAEARTPIVQQIIWVLRLLLLLAIAALSLAVFWIVGMMLGIL